MQRHLLISHRRHFLPSFLLYSTVVYTNATFRHFFCIHDLTSSIDAGRFYVDLEISCELIF
jgi:hypothetical protein